MPSALTLYVLCRLTCRLKHSADIMLHEIMVHAVPIMTGATVNQSALSIENPARVQAEVRQRGNGDHGTLKPQLP